MEAGHGSVHNVFGSHNTFVGASQGNAQAPGHRCALTPGQFRGATASRVPRSIPHAARGAYCTFVLSSHAAPNPPPVCPPPNSKKKKKRQGKVHDHTLSHIRAVSDGGGGRRQLEGNRRRLDGNRRRLGRRYGRPEGAPSRKTKKQTGSQRSVPPAAGSRYTDPR